MVPLLSAARILALAAVMLLSMPAAAQDAAARALAASAIDRQTPPAAFGFQFSRYPAFSIYRRGPGQYRTDAQPRSFFAASLFTAPIFYASASGSTSAACTSEATACVPARAITVGNATGAAYQVAIKAGTYDRSKDLTDSAGTLGGGAGAVVPTQDAHLFCYGIGRCEIGPFRLVTSWAVDGTFSNLYSGAAASTFSVWNRRERDAYGNYTECVKYADATTLSAATLVGSACGWAQNGSNTSVRYGDSRAVNNENTRLYIQIAAMKAGTKNLLVTGLNIEGGSPTVDATASATRNLVFVDCDIGYAGVAGTGRNVISVDNMSGLAGFFRVKAHNGTSDVYNFHITAQPTPGVGLDVLGVDSSAYTAGQTGSVSNNLLTPHDTAGIRVLWIGGTLAGAAGGAVRPIGTSQVALYGTTIDGDAGDVQFGGSVTSTAIRTDDTAKVWAQEVTVRGVVNAYDAQAGTAIYVRNPQAITGGQTGGGTIGGF